MAEYLMEPDMKLLDTDSPSAYDSAYIGYGKGGGSRLVAEVILG